MRRVPVFGILAALLATLVAVGIAMSLERVTVRRRQDPGVEARADRYLAFDRFMTRMGRPLTRRSDADALGALPRGGALILDRQRAFAMTDQRVADLFGWVGGGGYLILIPEEPGETDTVAATLQLSWKDLDQLDDVVAIERGPSDSVVPPDQVSVLVPGHAKPLVIPFSRGLDTAKVESEWVAATAPFGAGVVHLKVGRGAVTVLPSLDRFLENWAIADEDQAELVWTLLSTYQPRGSVMFLSQMRVPSLTAWLMAELPLAMFGTGVLIALWLWRIVPRFGSARPEPPASRRELREHLLAIGRFIWDVDRGVTWARVVRESTRNSLARRHPAMASAVQDVVLAETDAVADVAGALDRRGRRAHRAAFVSIVRTLQQQDRSVR